MTTTAELLEEYRQNAIRHATASKTGKYKVVNHAHDELARISHHFRRGGTELQQTLLTLLDDVEPPVRLWAATHALEFAPDKSLPVLRALAAGSPGIVRHDAEMTLVQWDKGELLPLP
ncbi:MAG: DUF2019 domain-containing protein [Nitrospira sp.]|nr:DUF2019 domain-containing protein [Nitrospira sp.]